MNLPLRVKNLINRHGTSSPYQIADDLGVTVVPTKLPARTYGFWQRLLRRKYIFVNEALPDDLQRFVVAHELGHIILHHNYAYYYMENRTYYADATKEEQADEFARLLVDASLPIAKGALRMKT